LLLNEIYVNNVASEILFWLLFGELLAKIKLLQCFHLLLLIQLALAWNLTQTENAVIAACLGVSQKKKLTDQHTKSAGRIKNTKLMHSAKKNSVLQLF